MEHLYSREVMERYRRQGEGLDSSVVGTSAITPFKSGNNKPTPTRDDEGTLPPHAFKTADDAFRAMKLGLENAFLMNKGRRGGKNNNFGIAPADQSILVR